MKAASRGGVAIIASAAMMALAACSPASESGTYVGYVEADWTYVSAPQAGWIVGRPVAEGARVDAGDLLFELDSDRQRAAIAQADATVAAAAASAANTRTGARAPEISALQAQLAQEQANLDAAQSERSRILPLVAEGIETRLRGDQLEAAWREAQARVANAQQQIAVARLAGRPALRAVAEADANAARAARDAAKYDLSQRRVTAGGTALVTEVFQKPGEYVTQGTPVVALLPTDGLKVRFFVSQADLPGLAIGKRVLVKADGLPAPVAGRISFIAKEAEFTPPVIYSKDARGKLVFLIEATMPSIAKLNPGLPVDVSVS